VAEASGIDRELALLEAELKRLEAEYNMFFAGRLPRPPWETRSRVQAIVKRIDRTPINNYGDKFRFSTLQSRYSTFVDLWDRGLRAREEGRPGPFAQPKKAEPERPTADATRIMHVTTFSDPLKEMDKLHDLYESLAEARREAGDDAVPFHRFAELIKTQVTSMTANGSPEVAFRVAIKDGKVSFTARALKGAPVE
jgi:hypothetical protein